MQIRVFVISILTACYVVFTGWIIWEMRKDRKIQLRREIMGKVYNPLIKDLKGIKIDIEYFKSPYHSPWGWESLKEKQRILTYKLPREIFKNLEDFTLKFRRYENFRRQLEVKLIEMVGKEVKKRMSQLNQDSVWGAYFQGKIGGELCKIDLFQLLFWNETFDQHKDRFIEENPTLRNKKLLASL